MWQKYIFFTSILLILSCDPSTGEFFLKGRNCCTVNAVLVSDIIDGKYKKDSLFLFSGKHLVYNSTSIRDARKNFIVFPENGIPSSSSSPNIAVSEPRKLKLKLYYDKVYENQVKEGSFQRSITDINHILLGFQNGYTIELSETEQIEQLDFDYRNDDQLFRDLSEMQVIDPRYHWHILLLAENRLLSGESAFHSQSKNHNLIVGDDFIVRNPIVLLHEIMHGFSGHADLEPDDSIINDSSAVVQNIMYNYDIPKIPRYSFYQNMFANEISGSNFLGINMFPLNLRSTDFGQININVGSLPNGKLIGSSDLIKSSEEYFIKLLRDPVENYLLNYESTIENHPEIIKCSAQLEDYLINPNTEEYISHYSELIRKEAKFLSIYGPHNKGEYVTSRLHKHLRMRERKIIHWLVAYEEIASTHYLDLQTLIPETMKEYYHLLKERRKGRKEVEEFSRYDLACQEQ